MTDKNKKNSIGTMPVKSMNIRFYNRPKVAPPFDFLLDDAGVRAAFDGMSWESEVGPPMKIAGPFSKPHSLPAFELKKPRNKKQATLPAHPFGKMDMGDAFAHWAHEVIPVPIVGSSRIVHPKWSQFQNDLVAKYKVVAGDAVYVIHATPVLGVSHKLFMCAPESNPDAKTRGVYWQTAGVPFVCLKVPFSSDLRMHRTNEARQGNSGLSLRIETLVDNTASSVVGPYHLVVYSFITNLTAACIKESSVNPPVEVPLGLRFTPVVPAVAVDNSAYDASVVDCLREYEKIWGRNVAQADDAPTTDPIAGAEDSDPPEPTVALPLATEVEAPLPVKTETVGEVVKQPKQTQAIQNKWVNIQTFTLETSDIGVPVTINIKPSISSGSATNKGEDLSRPWRRNVWQSGSQIKGYNCGLEIKIRTTRSPQVGGILHIHDMNENKGELNIINIGAQDRVVVLFPNNFSNAGNGTTPARRWTSPWIHASQVDYSFAMTLIALNRTDAVEAVEVKIMARPGFTIFQGNRKPQAQIAPVGLAFTDLMTQFSRKEVSPRDLELMRHVMCDTYRYHGHSYCQDDGCGDEGDDLDESPSSFDGGSGGDSSEVAEYINAAPGDGPVAGVALYEQGEEDDLEQNDYQVPHVELTLLPGEPISISIDMPILSDLYGGTGDSTIREQFARYVQVSPKAPGQYGPSIGQYRIDVRVDTGVSGQIAHLALPGDMPVEAAAVALGLSSILEFAGSAISSFGGPLLNAALDTATSLLPGPLKPMGGMVGNIIQNVANSVLGPKPAPNKGLGSFPTSVHQIMGDLPIGRFLSLLKPVVANEDEEPALPFLMVQLLKVFGSAFTATNVAPAIPITLWVRNSVRFERETFDRTVTYDRPTTTSRGILLDVDQAGELIGIALDRKNTIMAYKIVANCVRADLGITSSKIDVTQLEDIVIDTSSLIAYAGRLSDHRLTLEN